MGTTRQFISTIILSIMMFTGGLFAFAGGDGTESNPYQITTADHLNEVRNYLSSYFIMKNDIDLTDYLLSTGEGYNTGAFWNPVGDGTNLFRGKFNGDGYSIINLKINRPSTANVGFFGYTAFGASIENLQLVNANVIGANACGALVGANRSGNILNCGSLNGTVNGGGGLAIGGLVGFSGPEGRNYSFIKRCFSSGIVTGTNMAIGGLVGQNGEIGALDAQVIEDSYSSATVNGGTTGNMVGGLVGALSSCGWVMNCYSTGKPTGGTNVGGFMGAMASISNRSNNNYWDTETSQVLISGGDGGIYQDGTSSTPPQGRTTAQMKLQSNYTSWDFTTIWHISADNNGYPHFFWQLLFPPLPPIANAATNITMAGFTANWSTSVGATGYYMDVATDSIFTNFVSGYNNKTVGLVNALTVTALTNSTQYYYRVRAYNAYGTGDNSSKISVSTLGDFTDIPAGLPGVMYGSSVWGDYDNDGDLDILLTGDTYSTRISKIYSNDNDLFTDMNAGLTGVLASSVAWGDYDNDGDLDILLTGACDIWPNRFSSVYRNDTGVFTDINASLTGISGSSVAWGDYDNDGDLDILLTGACDTWPYTISRVYRNDTGVFTDINASLPGVYVSSSDWGDYDNDGDLDILLTGSDTSVSISKIYRNDNGTFTDINAGLPRVFEGSVAWGDYDNDGDLDILLTGFSTSVLISKIYRNDNGTFTDINASLPGVYISSADWGDYDNDGDLDILLTGDTGSGNISKIYRNDNGSFTDINAGLPGVKYSSVAWGDYDNDGDLDILLTGYTGSTRISKVYRNNSAIANAAPTAPASLSAQTTAGGITFSWAKATDSQTPQNGLSYNIAIGSTTNSNMAKSSHSNITNGYRKVVALGNTNQLNSYKLSPILPQTTYRWSVQAIDNAYTGSVFTAGTPISTWNLAIFNDAELTVNQSVVWESAYLDYVTFYQIQISASNSFTTTVIDTLIAKSSLVTKDDKGLISLTLNRLNKISTLQNNTTYYWRMKPIYNTALETFFSPTPSSFVFKTESPNSPTNGLPSGTSVAVTTTTLSWTAPTSGVTPTSYTVYFYSEADLFTSPIINGANVTGTSWNGLTLNDYTLYKACVFANYDPAVKGTSPALEWFFRTSPGRPVPQISSAGNTITILWEPVRGATSYKVYSSTDPYSGFALNNSGTLIGTTWTAPNAGNKLFYYVVAVN